MSDKFIETCIDLIYEEGVCVNGTCKNCIYDNMYCKDLLRYEKQRGAQDYIKAYLSKKHIQPQVAGNDVLKVRYWRINKEYYLGEIIEQNDNIITRGDFEDSKITSCANPAIYNKEKLETFYIRGDNYDRDNVCFIISQSILADLLDEIKKLNDKYFIEDVEDLK